MGSFLQTGLSKEKKLSAEGVGISESHLSSNPASSPNSPTSLTGSKNGSLLNFPKKKVGQSGASRCENRQGAYFECKHGHVIYRTLSCHARFDVDCPYCAREWRKKVRKNLEQRISIMVFPAFVTLTLRKPGRYSLQDLNALVHRCRKYLRRQGYKIRACVSCLAPPNHVHAVWDCTYIPHARLSNTWKGITGDSFEVWIKQVEKHRWGGAVNYLTKYITKISREGSSVAFKGVHVVVSWGNGGYYKKIRMMCKRCGSSFSIVLDPSQVDDVDNDAVIFVEMDPG